MADKIASILNNGAPALLTAEDLQVVLRNRDSTRKILGRLTFQVNSNEVFGIVGESGSGKTMTILSIVRLLPEGMEMSGVIQYKGIALAELPEKSMIGIRGREISMVFQDPLTALDPTMRIGSQMVEVLKGEGKVSTRQATKLSVELLRKVGIPDPQSRMDAYPFQLSGGMRQRVMIAIALLRKPALLLADEPTTALDVSIQMQILDLLLDLKDGLGMSIVFVTHDMGVVAKMCDRVMVLYSGRAMETGTVKELFARPRHPYTRALLGCIPSLTHRRKDKLPTLKGAPNPTRHERGCPFFERCDRGLEKCQRVDPEEIRFSDSQAASCWNPVPH